MPAPGPSPGATELTTGALGAARDTVTVALCIALASALQYAVWPVKTSAVEQPSASVTVSVTLYLPALAYACDAVGVVVVSVWPSPKLHSYLATVPSGAEELLALKVLGVPALAAVAEKAAVGP